MTSSVRRFQNITITSEMSIMLVTSSEEIYTTEKALKLILQNIKHCQPNPAKSSRVNLNKLYASLKSS